MTDAEGNQLAYIQEPKEEDADFWVVLPKALNRGEKFIVRTTYKGRDAISTTTASSIARRSAPPTR